MSDINVLEACIQDRHLTLQQPEGLGVITTDFRLSIWVEINGLEDSMKPISLPSSVFKGMELCLSCRCCYRPLLAGFPVNGSSEESNEVTLTAFPGVGVISE